MYLYCAMCDVRCATKSSLEMRWKDNAAVGVIEVVVGMRCRDMHVFLIRHYAREQVG